jgi:hypothetical protein
MQASCHAVTRHTLHSGRRRGRNRHPVSVIGKLGEGVFESLGLPNFVRLFRAFDQFCVEKDNVKGTSKLFKIAHNPPG